MPESSTGSLPRLLLTGFEPFGEATINPSWELVRRFAGNTIDMATVEVAQLPVSWAGAWPALEAAILRVQPTWVLMLGLASRRDVVTPETRARNYTEPIADNVGAMPPLLDRVVENGPAYRICTISPLLVLERLQESGIHAEVSTDAGGYLCNWVLYHALAFAADRPALRGVGFLHIPQTNDAGGPGPSLDRLERGLSMVIDSLVAGAAPAFALVARELAAERQAETHYR
ncbi:MAG TPA: pyroglutamyl-peptidase I [Chloroflexia bacterium]|nr:pyroglutamyl-peptidase I [Chloroflexia bacterium]